MDWIWKPLQTYTTYTYIGTFNPGVSIGDTSGFLLPITILSSWHMKYHGIPVSFHFSDWQNSVEGRQAHGAEKSTARNRQVFVWFIHMFSNLCYTCCKCFKWIYIVHIWYNMVCCAFGIVNSTILILIRVLHDLVYIQFLLVTQIQLFQAEHSFFTDPQTWTISTKRRERLG